MPESLLAAKVLSDKPVQTEQKATPDHCLTTCLLIRSRASTYHKVSPGRSDLSCPHKFGITYLKHLHRNTGAVAYTAVSKSETRASLAEVLGESRRIRTQR